MELPFVVAGDKLAGPQKNVIIRHGAAIRAENGDLISTMSGHLEVFEA